MHENAVLVVMALEIEAQGLFRERGVDVLFTGIGKINAAHRLTQKLAVERPPDWVLATIHPSAALRAENRDEMYAGLVADLRVAAQALADRAHAAPQG